MTHHHGDSRALHAVIAIGALACTVGCSKTPVSGVFVDKASPTEVDMIRVVESPYARSAKITSYG